MPLYRSLHLLGAVCYGLSAVMAAVAGLGWIQDDPTASAFLWTALCGLLTGLVLRIIGRRAAPASTRDAIVMVVFGWILAGLLAAVPFWASGCAGPIDSVFESFSGLTTTGATIFTSIPGLSFSILLWRAVIQWLGGLGIVMVVTLLLGFIESQGTDVLRTEAGLITKKLSPRLAGTALILAEIYLGLTLLEAVFLMLGGVRPFEASCHAMTTISTGGFSTRAGSVGEYSSVYVEGVTMAFMLLGATNFVLHYRFLRGDWGVYWRSTEFKALLGVIGTGGLIIAAGLIRTHGVEDWSRAVREGVYQAVSFGTTTGYTTAAHGRWPDLAKFVLVLLMLVGGCVGSTSGSIKLRRWAIVLQAVYQEFVRAVRPGRVVLVKIDGEVVDRSVVRKFVIFTLLYVFLLVVSGLLLVLTGLDPETAFSAAATCQGGVGPALGTGASDMASFSPAAKLLLTGLMLAGRLELFTVLLVFSPLVWRAG